MRPRTQQSCNHCGLVLKLIVIFTMNDSKISCIYELDNKSSLIIVHNSMIIESSQVKTS